MPRRTDPGQVSAATRRLRILELRTLGQTLEQIGQDPQVGLAKSNVKKQLDKALDDISVEQAASAARLKALAYGRLERMLAKAMLLAVGGNLKAMAQAQKLIMSQARILGFDAPIKHAQTDPTGENERTAPGLWTLPGRPDATIEEWQAEAARVWEAQQQREAQND